MQVQGQCNGTKRRSPVRPCFTDSVGISTRNRIQGIPIDEIGERRECGLQSREIFETRGNSIIIPASISTSSSILSFQITVENEVSFIGISYGGIASEDG